MEAEGWSKRSCPESPELEEPFHAESSLSRRQELALIPGRGKEAGERGKEGKGTSTYASHLLSPGCVCRAPRVPHGFFLPHFHGLLMLLLEE